MWAPIAFETPDIISKPFEDYAADLQDKTKKGLDIGKVWITVNIQTFGYRASFICDNRPN